MIETADDIKTIANVGTGTMGHAITLQFALAGYPVHLVGRSEASLEKAMKAIRSDAEVQGHTKKRRICLQRLESVCC